MVLHTAAGHTWGRSGLCVGMRSFPGSTPGPELESVSDERLVGLESHWPCLDSHSRPQQQASALGGLGGDVLLLSGAVPVRGREWLGLGESSGPADHAHMQLRLRRAELWASQLPEKREEPESVCSVPESSRDCR